MKITIATPHKYNFIPEYICNLAFTVMSLKGWQVELIMTECGSIYNERNKLFYQARDNGSDYLLFIDSDMVFNHDALSKLLAHQKDVVSGVYYSRAYPYRPHVYMFSEKGLIKNLADIPETLFKADAAGCGFLLLSKKILHMFNDEKAFNPVIVPFDNGTTLGEDSSFYHRLKERGVEVWFDPAVRLGHDARVTIHKEHFDSVKQQLLVNQPEGEIQGWMRDEELKWLQSMAAGMKNIVEIGSWRGRSTKALLDGCSKGMVHAVDHFKGSEDPNDGTHQMVGDNEVYYSFMENVGHYPNLKVLKMDSSEAVNKFKNNSVDMVFIDSTHTYEEVKTEIKRWLPKAKKIICGHDYCNEWPSVMRAVEESFDLVQVHESIWAYNLNGGKNGK